MPDKPPISSVKAPTDEKGERNLATFDRLDFESWNKKDVPLFREFHADDVLVQYPDGSTTKGIEEHVEWANGFWSAFDSEISEHPGLYRKSAKDPESRVSVRLV